MSSAIPGRLNAGPEKTRATFLRERKDAVYENLRDLNFEFRAGKVPEVDYTSMKASLEEEAAAILAEISRIESGKSARENHPAQGAKDLTVRAGFRAALTLLCPRQRIFFLFAATLTGKITNGTTNKPSAGDEVILIKLAAGMEEVGHAKTDAAGKFSFTFADADSPHLVRAIHQGVTYHQPAPPGTNSVDVTVYDVSTKVSGVHAVADLMYLQASQGKLGVTRIFAVDNTSKPPMTQMNDANFEFYLPEGAEIDDAQAQTQGGQPLKIDPTPQAEKGRYAFAFPLRPGQTQLQVSYHLTYCGKATVDPRLIYPLQHFVAIMPRTIGFTPAQAGVYEDRQPPDQPDAIAEVANNPKPGQKLAFEISGEGMMQSQDEQASGQTSAPATASNSNTNDTRPGGGLGPPIEAPDPARQIPDLDFGRLRGRAGRRRHLHHAALQIGKSRAGHGVRRFRQLPRRPQRRAFPA